MQEDTGHNTTIGKRIKKAREYRNMSRTELGITVGFPKGSAYRRVLSYEKGERIPKKSILNEFAEALKIDIDWFNFEDEIQIENISFFEHGADGARKQHIKARINVEKEIYCNLYRLTDSELQRIIEMIQSKGGTRYARRS